MRKLGMLLAAALIAGTAPGQTAAPRVFEVASVRPAAPCCAAGQWRESKAGDDRIDFRYVTLRYCIAFAYRVKEFQIAGPAWIGETRYDIIAKGPEGTRHDQLPDMLQRLLEDRFKLQAHHETREFNVMVIAVGRNGPKLKESASEPGGSEGANIEMGMSPDGVGHIEVKHGNMTALASTLSRVLGRPVVDLTGLTARYDFALEFAREDAGGIAPPGSAEGPPSAEFGASIFTSIQRLGLKLETQKPPLDSIVVDRAEKTPTGN